MAHLRPVCLLPIGALACTAGPPDVDDPDPTGLVDHHTVAVVTTASATYDAGALAVVDLDGGTPRDVATIHADAVVRVEDGMVWQVNRLLVDSVRAYAPGDWALPAMEVSTGTASNPHDVALCGDALVVARYEEASLLRVDWHDGHTLGTVDLSAAADADTLPEADRLVWLGDRLFVGLQRLDRTDGWTSAPGGWLGEVPCDGDALGATWPVGPNPVIAGAPGLVVVAAEDGVRSFDGDAVSDVRVADVDGAAIVDLAFGDDGRGAFIARDGGHHRIGCLDTATWTPVVAQDLDAFVSGVAVDDRGEAWFAVRQGWEDPSDLGGLVVVDLDTCTARPTRVATHLPPFAIAFY
ncbi:MAG: hypothetical protein H6733_16085 [Alphaproteobacteria bacterium]|nr:hypothetical protein [Alphaproteobacteria bacterium]